MRNKYIKGYKNPELNTKITEICKLNVYMSKYKILEHFYHTDTFIDEKGVRLQGYVYPEDLYSDDSISEIAVPGCEVAYRDDRLILVITSRYEIKN